LKKAKTSFFCQHCGYMSPKWLGKCPSCGGWNCFAEEVIVNTGSDSRAEMRFDGKPLPIEDIPLTDGKRTVTGIAEVDRVLGGGIVGGSAILIGGEPGIGKSTLMLQVMHNLADKGLKVLYVSGEESASQIKLRSDRIGAAAKFCSATAFCPFLQSLPKWHGSALTFAASAKQKTTAVSIIFFMSPP